MAHDCIMTAVKEALKMTTWQKPDFIDLSMNAEIGSYQEDFGGRNTPPLASARTDTEPQPDKAR